MSVISTANIQIIYSLKKTMRKFHREKTKSFFHYCLKDDKRGYVIIFELDNHYDRLILLLYYDKKRTSIIFISHY